jgi:glucose-6-phosphate 1-dehydrogenase
VAAGSQVETFAAVEFHIETERWSGVPFFVRVGKRLPVSVTEILVRFKQTRRPVLDEVGPPLANYFRFRLAPETTLALGTKVKRPGDALAGERIELVAHHQRPDEMLPYERLLEAAANGDPTLFAREDAVEESWRIVNPILGDVTPLYQYTPGTWGPPEVDRLVSPDEGWRDPVV